MLEYIQDLNVPHIVGGVFTTSAPDRALRESVVKMIGVFEGERTVIEIINRIKTKSNFENIKGTWIKTKHGIQNPPQPLVDISDLTPDYSLFDDVRFVRPYKRYIKLFLLRHIEGVLINVLTVTLRLVELYKRT